MNNGLGGKLAILIIIIVRLRVRVNAVVLELPGNFPLLGSIEQGFAKESFD